MAWRGVLIAHTIIMRWVQRYVREFERRWNRFARRAGAHWRDDETYVKIRGRRTSLHRAVDSDGKRGDGLRRAKWDVAAAPALLSSVRESGRLPRAITLDGYQASPRTGTEILGENRRGQRTKIRSSKFEQPHRAGSPIAQTARGSNALIEAFSPRLGRHSRDRSDAQDQKGSVHARQTSYKRRDCARNPACGSCCLNRPMFSPLLCVGSNDLRYNPLEWNSVGPTSRRPFLSATGSRL